MKRLVVNVDNATLNDFVQERFKNIRRGVLTKALKAGEIKVNGERVNKNIVVNRDDVIEIFLYQSDLGEEPELRIVFEDENLMIVNKQPGILSLPKDGESNIFTMAEDRMKENNEYSFEALILPYLCQKLERYTGGLMMVAKNEDTFHFIMSAVRQRRVRKFFRTLVVERIKNGPGQQKGKKELHHFLMRDRLNKKVHILENQVKNSLPIVTRYRVLETLGDLAELEVELVTYAMHQIQAHLSYVGYPILGDTLYGNKQANRKYNAVHPLIWAKRLVFDVGTGHAFQYLKGKVFESAETEFPSRIYDLTE